VNGFEFAVGCWTKVVEALGHISRQQEDAGAEKLRCFKVIDPKLVASESLSHAHHTPVPSHPHYQFRIRLGFTFFGLAADDFATCVPCG